MKLDQVLGNRSIILEHDGVTFALREFTVAQAESWNDATYQEQGDDDALTYSKRVTDAQMKVIAEHMRACVTDGSKQKVTPKWLKEQFPQPIVQDLATYFANGTRPEWAGERGN